MALPSFLSEGNGIFWVSLAAGLLGLVLGKVYSQIANMIRSSQMLADMPKPPDKVSRLSRHNMTHNVCPPLAADCSARSS